jgi:hypothetical protein
MFYRKTIYMKLMLLMSLMISHTVLGKDSNIYVVDFLANLDKSQNPSCFKSDGTFNESRCEKKTEDCNFSKKFLSFNKVKLKFTHNGYPTDRGSISTNNIYITGMDSRQYSSYDLNYPIGAEVSIYSSSGDFRSERNFNLFHQGKLSANGEVDIRYDKPTNKKFIFKLPDTLSPGERYGIEIFNENLFMESTDHQKVVNFSSGIFYLKIYKMDNQQRPYKIQKIKLVIPESHVATSKIFQIPDTFKDYTASSDNKLSWKSSENVQFVPTFSLYNNEPGHHLSLDILNKVQIPELGNEDLKEYFNIKNGEAILKEDKESLLMDKLKQIPIHTLKVEAICYKGDVKPAQISYPIMLEPNDKSKQLGTISFKYGPTDQDLDSKVIMDGKGPVQFQANLDEGGCRGEDPRASVHAVTKAQGDWIHLGKGAWGDGGWIKIKYNGIENHKGLQFMNLYRVSITPIANGKVMIVGYEEEHDGYESGEDGLIPEKVPPKPVQFKLDIEKLWYQGNFLPRYGCSGYGC